MLQELLAVELGVELGSYHHLVGSLHLYRRHFELAKRIVACSVSFPFEMPMMEARGELPSLLRMESVIRTETRVGSEIEALHPYWRDLLDVLQWHSLRKLNNGQEPDFPAESKYAPLLRLSTSLAGKPQAGPSRLRLGRAAH